MGRKSAAHHARLEASTYNDFAVEFELLAAGMEVFLDSGDFDAFAGPLHILDDLYEGEMQPLGSDEPRGRRLREYARRYARATFAKTYLQSLLHNVQGRIDGAQALMIATAAEPVDIPQYWQKLVTSVRAAGIRQEDIHPGSRALALHIAAAIREFKAGAQPAADETYNDAPLSSWADLPREFAGFRLVDVHPDDNRLGLQPFICPLPPSTDIATYTADRATPRFGSNRHETYKAWAQVIDGWGVRTNRTLDRQQAPIWAMLLANRLDDDGSNVKFFHRQMIQSPWKRDGIVEVKVIEDDIPDRLR